MEVRGADSFARLAHELHDQEGFEETLELLVESAPALVGSDVAGVLLARRRRIAEPGPGSDALALKADALQLEFDEGPALATADQHTVVCHDTSIEERWPRWAAAAGEVGIASACSVRLWTSSATLGAITFYATRPRVFDETAIGIAEIVGRHASIALASALQEESLNRAVDGRKLVGQAQGILMERFDLDDRRAFDVLRRYSQASNTKLVEVARLLVTKRSLPDI